MKTLILLIISFGLYAASWPTPFTYQKILHTGIDVNWATFAKEITAYSKKEPRDFKAIGFNHIRIRFKDPDNAPLSHKAYIDHLERIVNDVLDAGMIPILAFGAQELKEDPSDENFAKALSVWREIAHRFANTSPLLSFDLIIEPGKALKKMPERLNDFYERAIRLIRHTNPKRIIFIAPPKLAHPDSLDQLHIPSKANGYLMVETHFYAAGPSKTNPKKRWTTGTKEEKEIFLSYVQDAIAWQRTHHIPVWIGAIMPSNYNHGDDYTIEEQKHFAHFIACTFKRYHLPFAINADHQFYDFEQKRWRDDRKKVLQAILHPCCQHPCLYTLLSQFHQILQESRLFFKQNSYYKRSPIFSNASFAPIAKEIEAP